MRVRAGGVTVAVTLVGSTFSGVSPFHHFSTAGLANQQATKIASNTTSHISRCCSQRKPLANRHRDQRSQPGGCQEPTSARSNARRGLQSRARNFTSTSLAAASF